MTLNVSIYTGIDGYKFWKKGQMSAVVGVGLLILVTIAVPIALALFAS
jgi:hypothetical protein